MNTKTLLIIYKLIHLVFIRFIINRLSLKFNVNVLVLLKSQMSCLGPSTPSPQGQVYLRLKLMLTFVNADHQGLSRVLVQCTMLAISCTLLHKLASLRFPSSSLKNTLTFEFKLNETNGAEEVNTAKPHP